MLMKNCPKCSELVSVKVTICPNCGHSLKKYEFSWLKTVMAVLIIIGMVYIFGMINRLDDNKSMSNTTSNRSVSREPAKVNVPNLQERIGKAIQVTAAQLSEDYQSNEVSANQKYKDKDLIISGRIESISQTFGTPQVTLTSGRMFFGVTINLEKSQESTAANLSKGQEIKVFGVGGGNLLNVVIDKGIILQ